VLPKNSNKNQKVYGNKGELLIYNLLCKQVGKEKTGDGKSFIISPGELEFAKQKPNQFKLFLVYEIDDENPKYLEIPAKFWENNKFRKAEIIERIEFRF
jgi:hypothetical protein